MEKEKQTREQAENQLAEDMSLFFETTSIPVCCFQDKNLIRKISHPVQDFNLPLLLFDGLPDTLPDVWYSYTPEYLYFGGLRLQKTDRILLIGPSMLFECTKKQAENVCRQLGRKSTDLTAIQNYFTQIGPHTAVSLQAGLKLLCRLSGQNIPEEIPLLSFSWRVPYSLDLTPLPDPENPEDENREKVLLSCVTSGNLYALNRLINEHMLNVATVRQLPLTAMRSFILGANMVASRAAMSAGVSYDIANAISGQYLERILQSRDAAELSHLFYQFFQDYTAQVSKLHELPSDSPVVRFVQQYTISHLEEKITPHSLAEELHMSCSYLCTHFKQETGMTISAYVQQEKVREAKRLLKGSSYSIVEISEALAFSSQSYFCAVFKKITGMTPESYRSSPSILTPQEVSLPPRG